MARSLLKTRGLPAAFWGGEAVTIAVYLLNRAPTKSMAGKTLFEAWHGHKPAIEHLRVFGCVAYVKATRPNLKKLDDQSTAMVFIGYEPGAKAWRFYDPVARRVHVSRDAVFKEQESWDWSKMYDDESERTPEFNVDYALEEVVTNMGGSPGPTTGHDGPSSSNVGASPPAPTATFVSPPPNAHEYLDSGNDVTP
jgi:hypothetical protein